MHDGKKEDWQIEESKGGMREGQRIMSHLQNIQLKGYAMHVLKTKPFLATSKAKLLVTSKVEYLVTNDIRLYDHNHGSRSHYQEHWRMETKDGQERENTECPW